MTIQVKFSSSELVGKLRDGAYEMPDSATVSQLMEEAQRESGFTLTQQQKDNCVFVFDNSPATYETCLLDGGKLRVMFKILGG